MVRYMSWLLGGWLVLLYVVGRSAHVPVGLLWLTLLGGILALLGGAIAPLVSSGWRVAGPVMLSLGLLGLFAVELAMKVESWLPWCTFIAVVCYLPVVIALRLWSPKWSTTEHEDWPVPRNA